MNARRARRMTQKGSGGRRPFCVAGVADGLVAAGVAVRDGHFDRRFRRFAQMMRMQNAPKLPAPEEASANPGRALDSAGQREEQGATDDWSLAADHLIGPGGLLWIDNWPGPGAVEVHFVQHDIRGNVTLLWSDADGAATARYEYGPFGELLRATGPMAKSNPFRFSTKYHDDETDLLYYGYRYYAPGTGRWVSRDPIGESGGLNTYCGMRNDLNDYADRLGLKHCVGAGVQTFGIGGQGNIGPIGYTIVGRGSLSYQHCSTCCGKEDDIVDITASFSASFTGSSGFATVAGIDWNANVRYGFLVRGGVQATAGARYATDRCNGKGLTGNMCLSGKGSLGIGGGAYATVTVAGMVQQAGADLMGNGYATITRCYECDNDRCEWGKTTVWGGADITATFYLFLANFSVVIWKGEACIEL